MNKQRIVWLHEQLPTWEEKGWISKEHAAQMRVFYGTIETKNGPSWRRLLVLLLGLLLISLGLFLLFAGYWYSFSPAGRMDWCIALLLVAVVALGLGVWKTPRSSLYAECVGLFYALALILSTWLMADTYYTGEGMGFYALICMVLLLPVVYLLGSNFTMIVYLLIALCWSVSAHDVTIWGEPIWLWLLLAAGSPFFAEQLRKRTQSYLSVLWLSWVYVGAIFGAIFFTINSYQLSLGLFFVAALSAATYALGSLSREQGIWSLPFRGVGVLGLMYVVVYGTFLRTWQEEAVANVGWLSIVLAILALALVVGGLHALWQKRQGPELLITLCPLVVGILMGLAHGGVAPLTVSIIFNLYVICLAIVLLWQGTMAKRVALVNGCIFTFLAIIGARFFDPAFTFVERGFTFIIVGAAIFVVNLFYMWRKQAQQGRINSSVANASRRMRRKKASEIMVEEAADTKTETTSLADKTAETTVTANEVGESVSTSSIPSSEIKLNDPNRLVRKEDSSDAK
ncbi:DUF2157 domain-containing protein [Veillonella criceti]|uniref:Predicted membrane protein (DUF2157) n=1 Tax=Veillonella criceti TaxID=103891 RepID=A0A380NMF7_9FIRM|nr:DUF2157 domain-containing protein [Veillonella criceti]SUP43440.1 Predicted membrane protein (DUF2157) [Veillonella criceti]